MRLCCRALTAVLRSLPAVLLLALALSAQTTVWTYHNNNARTGANTAETQLTPANVNSQQFGLLLRAPVDADIYAQPLYLPNVTLPAGQTRNLVFVVTENDSVYAFDAQGASNGQGATPVWVDHFTDPSQGILTQTSNEAHCQDLQPLIGITGTPVIDTSTGTLYVVAATMENGQPVQRLHALAVATGAEKFGGPAVISATVPGTGVGSANGQLSFNPLTALQRPGLLLSQGLVYVAWGSHCDYQPYHGWLMAFNAATLQPAATYVATPNGEGGGLWGGAPAADASGNVYVASGNLGFSPSTGDLGESIIRLANSDGQLVASDYFAPWDVNQLSATNADLSSQGVVLLPPSSSQPAGVAVAGNKAGDLYVLNPNDLGGYVEGPGPDTQIPEEEAGASAGVFGTPAYWNGEWYQVGTGGDSGLGGPLQAFAVNDDLLSAAPVATSSTWFDFPAGVPMISANGNSDGIVWLIEAQAWASGGPEVLHAYDAGSLQELYNSTQDSARDQAGPAVKFVAPAIADGEVFVPAGGELDIYGLLPGQFTVTASAQNSDVALGQPATIQVATTGVAGPIALSCSAPAAGCSFAPASVSPGGAATLTVAAAALAAGANTIVIAAQQGPVTQTATVTITAQGFTLAATPGSLSVMAGQSAAFPLAAAAQGGFSGLISLSCQPPGGANCQLSPASVTPGQTATATLSSLPAGTVTAATVTGSASDGATASATLTATAWDFSVLAAHPQTTVTRGANTAQFPLATAGIAGFSGTINFTCQAAPPLACGFAPASVSAGGDTTLTVSGIAQISASQAPITVLAGSGGDSHSLALTIAIADFSLAAASPTASVSPGQTASYALNLAPSNGWTGSIGLSCGGAPKAATCVISPPTVTLNGASQTTTVSVMTTPPGLTAALPPGPSGEPPRSLLWLLCACLLSLGLAAISRRRRWATRLGGALALAALALALAACGGRPADPPALPSTPPGTTTLTITATAGALVHSLPLTLVVK